MTLRIINFTSIAAGPVVDLGVADSLWVGRNGLIAAQGGYGVTGAGSNHRVHVEGTVVGAVGVSLGDDSTAEINNSVLISRTGVVSGLLYGLAMNGMSNNVMNFGLIDGGMYIFADGAGQSRIDNAGEIFGAANAVEHFGTEALVLVNSGTIRGLLAAFKSNDSSGAASELIRNSGSIFGDIVLGGGADTYDGRGGILVGAVYGGVDADTFRPGAGAETFDGGAGGDLLDFRDTGGIRVYLDNSLSNTLTAAGDTYVGIERIYGSTFGNDFLTGDAAANLLRGYGGTDTLRGGAGADLLIGGTGIDTLTGGTGDDAFWFQTLADGGDIITDFGSAAGNNDIFRIGTTLGGGLAAGPIGEAMFVVRADNLAQDNDDRFIFRTTDKTVWFDSNGNGAGGLTMIADLQSAATVIFSDFLIV